jgi:hypothetical protein
METSGDRVFADGVLEGGWGCCASAKCAKKPEHAKRQRSREEVVTA